MARMLHRSGKPANGQKAFLAIAAYQDVGAGCTFALAHSTPVLIASGIDFELAIYSGNCHVDDSRNRLVRDFLASDCTDMVFIDADVGWYAKDLVALLTHERDVVAGIYPKKHGDDTYPVKLLPGEIWSDRDGLIEVEGVPTGFLRIKRHVIEALAARAVTYNAKNDAASAVPCIFERQIHNGVRWGGDYVFCRKWRELGGKIYIDPSMRFEHSGEHTWVGSVGGWLRQRSGLGFVAGLEAFRKGTETPEDALDLFDVWGNPFAAEPVLLLALGLLARQGEGPILEMGCGLSTLVMAAAAPHREVHTLENDPVFLSQVKDEAVRHGLTNVHVHLCDTASGWYDTSNVPALNWTMAFVDGPRRTTGGRVEVFSRMDLSNAVVVADDVQADGGVPAVRMALERTHKVQTVGCARRSFAIAAPRPQMRVAAE